MEKANTYAVLMFFRKFEIEVGLSVTGIVEKARKCNILRIRMPSQFSHHKYFSHFT